MATTQDLAAIEEEGTRLLEYAMRDPEATVPHYPDWTLRDLVLHVASVHARTAAVCGTLPQERIPAGRLPDGVDPFDWYQTSLREMVEALGQADPAAEAWTIVPGWKLGSWVRRMVIETGVHRWDAQQAVEEPTPLLPLVATHGLDEFDEMYLPRLGDLPALDVVATDLDRTWSFGDGPGVTVSATASDLYLRLMARPGAELPAAWETAVDGVAKPTA